MSRRGGLDVCTRGRYVLIRVLNLLWEMNTPVQR